MWPSSPAANIMADSTETLLWFLPALENLKSSLLSENTVALSSALQPIVDALDSIKQTLESHSGSIKALEASASDPLPPPLSVSPQKRRSTTKPQSPGAKVRVTKGKAVGARATTLGAGGGKRSMAYRAKVTPALSGPLAQYSHKTGLFRDILLRK